MMNKGLRRIIVIGAGIIGIGTIALWLLFGIGAALIFLCAGLTLFLVFLFYTKKRYEKIGELNTYLSRVLSGDYNLSIADNEEGELSILQNNIYKAMVQLSEKNELLKNDKQYLSDMLANISHQLKTPLTSVMMMNDILSGETSEVKRREFMNIEAKQLDKMNWLIQNLLKLSKLDAGTIVYHKESVSVERLVRESLAPFMIQMDVEDISLKEMLSKGEITVDVNWTVEAVRNIIKNSLEHMGRGGRLEIEDTDNNLYHAIIIRDNGCGIAEEDIPHIFERFYKGRNASVESTGIGLSLAQTILGKEHGEITVTSKYGSGTEFELRFYKSII